jgi:hypothetical protein
MARRAIAVACCLALAGCGGQETATISVSLDRVLQASVQRSALGADLDGHGLGEIGQIYAPANLRAMRSTGLGPVAYRLRTELGSEAWHWNPAGRWSDPACQCGYWVSSDRPGARFAVSYGYRLPRRGNTIDQANNDGYSRLDDGSRITFWKSNPYVDPHPQWIMIDLGRPELLDAAELDWAQPYATSFTLEYWSGSTPPARYGAERENAVFASGAAAGAWHDLVSISGGGGGRQTLRFNRAEARYVRVRMTASSHTALPGSRDIRDRLGFAMREVRLGTMSGRRLRDDVRHAPSNAAQSVIWVSSTDPWHRASDRDPQTEQPSFDTVLRSGLTRGQPLLVPVPVAYGNPADAAAEIRWLERRRIPVGRIELGEEPDGQLIGPEDYGALYARFAKAIKQVDPAAQLGGPGFATAVPNWSAWPDGHRTSSWTARLLAELRRDHAQLSFFSFEWYPFDNVCSASAPALARQPALLRDVLARQYAAGLPRSVPLVITEYGYSPFAASAEVELAGGLLDADIAASFLAAGGSAAYVYGYEPDVPIRESAFCPTYGNLSLFESDDAHRLLHPLASYYAMRLLTQLWLDAAPQAMRPTSGAPVDVAAYALTGPGGRLALLMINKDPRRAARVRIAVGGHALQHAADAYVLGPGQYVWHARGASGYPAPDGPPAHVVIAAAAPVTLPAYSLVVVRERS